MKKDNDEKVQRQMEFIIEQQADFAVNIQLLQEVHDKGEKRLSRLESAFVAMYNDRNSLTKKVAALTESNKNSVAEQKENRERLDAFILVLERGISRD